MQPANNSYDNSYKSYKVYKQSLALQAGRRVKTQYEMTPAEKDKLTIFSRQFLAAQNDASKKT